jgi:hypothetical protein
VRRAAGKTPGRQVDRKGREFRSLGQFIEPRLAIHVYVSPPAKGQRREESARVVLVGHCPELRVNLDPWRAKQLTRHQALALLWDRLVELIDAKTAPPESADRFEAALRAEGLAPPAGPLHRPGLPKIARLILAYREAHPAASQRMVAAAVRCDQARVCQVYRKYGDPASRGDERRDECAMNIHREFIADSSRDRGAETGVFPEQNNENGITVPGANSSPPLCTSSLLRREDDGAPPPDAGVPRPGLEGPSRPVVAGNVEEKPRPAAPQRQPLLPGLEVVVEELRLIVRLVVLIHAASGTANLWEIERRRAPKPEGLLERAVELGYLEERRSESGNSRWWEPRHPQLLALVETLRASRRSAAS